MKWKQIVHKNLEGVTSQGIFGVETVSPLI